MSTNANIEQISEDKSQQSLQEIFAYVGAVIRQQQENISEADKISHYQQGTALLMLFFNSINGISLCALDVPNQNGLAYLDQSNGTLYHGPEIMLVALCMIANSIISIQQLVDSQQEIDRKKIDAKLIQLQNSIQESSKCNQAYQDILTEYRRSLNHDVQKRILECRTQLVKNQSHESKFELVEDLPEVNGSSPQALKTINDEYKSVFNPLLDVLSALDVLIQSDQSNELAAAEARLLAIVATLPEPQNVVETNLLFKFKKQSNETGFKLKELSNPSLEHNNNDEESEDLEPKISTAADMISAFKRSDQPKYALEYNPESNVWYDILYNQTLRAQFVNELIYFWFKAEKDKDTEIKTILDEFNLEVLARSLEINPDNDQYIGNSKLYKYTKSMGNAVGLINVVVNFGIGMGAFVSFSMILYALTGVSVLALIGTGWPLILAMLFFASLSMMVPYYVTRKYIDNLFESAAYNLKCFWDAEDKWQAFKDAYWHNEKMFRTLFVTIPSSIGLTIIAVMAFYAIMPIMPIALIMGVITFIACVSFFGGMFYESHDRLIAMMKTINGSRLMVPAGMATMIMIVIGVALFLNPITAPFMVMAPISAILLMAIVSIIVFTMSFAIYGKWPLKQSILASLGITTAVGQTIAIFCYTSLLISGPIGLLVAGALALFSFPLLFSWAVMSVALSEDAMEKGFELQQVSDPKFSSDVNSNDDSIGSEVKSVLNDCVNNVVSETESLFNRESSSNYLTDGESVWSDLSSDLSSDSENDPLIKKINTY